MKNKQELNMINNELARKIEKNFRNLQTNFDS